MKLDSRVSKLLKKYLEGYNVKGKLMKYLIKTKDGSYTVKSNFNETMHTIHGAITESFEKFVKPIEVLKKEKLKVLDICSGLGYNSAALIHKKKNNLKIDMIEISKEVLLLATLIPSPIDSHKLIKTVYKEKLYEEGVLKKIDNKTKDKRKNIKINVFCNDARDVIRNLKSDYYDVVFLDAYSPLRSPELYTVEFFNEVIRVMNKNSILTTYTSAAPVRSGMIEVGFYIGEGPIFGRKRGGTIASPNPSLIKKQLNVDDERMIALSDVGIPFRDPNLNDPAEKILKRRKIERKKARHKEYLSSSARTPLYLGKAEANTRAIKNAQKFGIEINSYEAKYIVCPQFDKCICGCNEPRPKNSRERILMMRKRLKKIKETIQ